MLYSTLEVHYGNPSGNFLGVHFSPILLLILPIYAIYQSPKTLLVLQSFILAIAALPLYWIAKDRLKNRLYALAFATVYLLNPALHGVNTFDFHLEIFTPALTLFAFHYIKKRKWLKAVPFIILEFMTLEFAPIIVFSLGLYFFLKKLKEATSRHENWLESVKKLILPITLMLLSILFFYLSLHVIEVINPLKKGAPHRVWMSWGSNIFEVVTNVIHNPIEAVTTIVTPLDKPYFIIFLFASVLLLPLFAPLELIMTFPWPIAALLSDYPPYYQPYYQYSAFVIGQIFLAAIFGFHNLFRLHNEEKFARIQKKLMLTLMMVSLLLFTAISPVGFPALTQRTPRPYSISTVFDQDHIKKLNYAINLLPSNASIATIWDIFPHVCQRLDAYFLDMYFLECQGNYPAEYILVDLKSPCLKMRLYGPTPDQILLKLMKNKEYGLLASLDGVMLLKRGYNGPLKHYEPQKDIFNYNHLIPASGKITWDYTSTFKKVISSNPDNSVGVIWFGPYRYFAPGSYIATFRIKTINKTCRVLLDIVSDHGNKLITLRTIYGKDFEQVNSWQEFSLRFRIDEPMELEFRGTSLSNNTQVVIDYITVEQIAP